MTFSEEALHLLRSANQHRRENRPQEALDSYKKALMIDPNCIDAWISLAGLFMEHERFEDAKTCIDQAAEVDPEHPLTLGVNAVYLCALGRYDEALDAASRTLERDPTQHMAHSTISMVCTIQGDYTAAEAAIRKALESKPDDFNLLYMLGQILYSTEQYQKGLWVMMRCTEARKDDAQAWLLAGKMNIKAGLRKPGVRIMEIAAGLAPDDLNIRLHVALSYWYADDFAEGEKRLKALISEYPSYAAAWEFLIELIDSDDRHEEATEVKRMYEELLRSNPNLEKQSDGFLGPKTEG